MKLVENWRSAWKWLSVQFIAAQVVWQTLPAEAVSAIPADWHGKITLALAVGALVGRMIDQGKGAGQ